KLDDTIALLPRQAFLIQSLEQSLGSQIGLGLRQHFGVPQFLVKNVLLGAGRKVRTGGHRNRPRKHRCEAGDNDNRSAFGSPLHSGEQAEGAHETVLDTKDKLSNASPAFDELLFFLDGLESHSVLISVLEITGRLTGTPIGWTKALAAKRLHDAQGF